MATKPTEKFTWATDALIAAGAALGLPTKVNPAGWPNVVQGLVPGVGAAVGALNKTFNVLGQWSGWLYDGSSAGAADAHLVETDANGLAVLSQCRVKTHKLKTADETVNNSNALQNDNHLTGIPVLAIPYRVSMRLIINGDEDGDFKYGFSAPAVSSGFGYGTMFDTVDLTHALAETTWSGTTDEPITTTAADHILTLEGIVVFSATGTYGLQWAQNAADASDLKVKAGSYLFLDPVN